MKLSSKQIKIICAVIIVGLLTFMYRKLLSKPLALAGEPGKEGELNTKGNLATSGVSASSHSIVKSANKISEGVNVLEDNVENASKYNEATINDGRNLRQNESSHRWAESGSNTADFPHQVQKNVTDLTGGDSPNDDPLPKNTHGTIVREDFGDGRRHNKKNFYTDVFSGTSTESRQSKDISETEQLKTKSMIASLQEQYEELKSELIELSGGGLSAGAFSKADAVFSPTKSPGKATAELHIADLVKDCLGPVYNHYSVYNDKVLRAIINIAGLMMQPLALYYNYNESLSEPVYTYLISSLCNHIIARAHVSDKLDEAMIEVSAMLNVFKQACPAMELGDISIRGVANLLYSKCIASKKYDPVAAWKGKYPDLEANLSRYLDIILPESATKFLLNSHTHSLYPEAVTEDMVTIILYCLNTLSGKQMLRDELVKKYGMHVYENPSETLHLRFHSMKGKLKTLLSDEEKKQRGWLTLINMEFEPSSYSSRITRQDYSAADDIEGCLLATDIHRIPLLQVVKSIYEIILRAEYKASDRKEKLGSDDKTNRDEELDNAVRKELISLFLRYITCSSERSHQSKSNPEVDDFLQQVRALYDEFFGENIRANDLPDRVTFSIDQVYAIVELIYKMYYIFDDEEFERYATSSVLDDDFKELIEFKKASEDELEKLRAEKLKIEAQAPIVPDYTNKEYLAARLTEVNEYDSKAKHYSSEAAQQAQLSFRLKMCCNRYVIHALLNDHVRDKESYIEDMRKFDADARTAQLDIDILQIQDQLSDLANNWPVQTGEYEMITPMRSCMLECKHQEIETFLTELNQPEVRGVPLELDKLQIKILMSVLSMPHILPDAQVKEGLSRLKKMRLHDAAEAALDSSCAHPIAQERRITWTLT